jgi:hypothetical protein
MLPAGPRTPSWSSLWIGPAVFAALAFARDARAQAPPDAPSATAPSATAQVVTPVPVQPGYGQPVYPNGQPAYPPGYVPPAYPPGYVVPVYPAPVYVQPGYAAPGYAPGEPPRSRRARRAAAMDPDNPPPGYHTETRARTGLIVGGAVTFGLPYLLSATAAASTLSASGSMYEPLFIPVVGPFITLGSAHIFAGTNDPGTQVARVFGGFGLMLDGLIQLGGATMLIVGLAWPREVVVPDRGIVPEVSFGPTGGSLRWSF